MGQKHSNKDKEAQERRYWVWVTRPEYYLDESGFDRGDLDPQSGADSGGWWTCHRDTRKGDLVLLYRSRLRRDIGYLIQTESDAYSITDDEYASEQNWDYGCDYRVLYKFENPVTLQDMRENPYLHDWGAYGGNFQRRVYEVPLAHWHRLSQALSERNAGYENFLATVQKSTVVKSIMLEEELEETLIHDLGRLKKVGYDLELSVSSIDGASGRQLVCKGNGGRIDLLCYDRKKKQYVVIELKNVRASQNTFGQICNYVTWVQERIAEGEPVIGLVISRGYDVRFQSSMKITDKIFHLDLEQIGFK
ncbi:MAG: PDDEXK nuclease domain-containing protein [Pyrinomonadaceae bacterium]